MIDLNEARFASHGKMTKIGPTDISPFPMI